MKQLFLSVTQVGETCDLSQISAAFDLIQSRLEAVSPGNCTQLSLSDEIQGVAFTIQLNSIENGVIPGASLPENPQL